MFETSHWARDDPYVWTPGSLAAMWTDSLKTELLRRGFTFSSSQRSLSNISNCQILVINSWDCGIGGANPIAPYIPSEIELIKSWVAQGGKLVILADRGPYTAPVGALTSSFGIGVTGDYMVVGNLPTTPHPIAVGAPYVYMNWYCNVTGGTPFLVDPVNGPIAAITDYGAGQVVVLGDSNLAIDPQVTPPNIQFMGNIFTYLTNTRPVASDSAATLDEDTQVEITLPATDADGDPLTYSIVTQPTHAYGLVVIGNKVTYRPLSNYHGPDSFTFKANDGTGDSNVAQVTIDVRSVYDPPYVYSPTISLWEDGSSPITLQGRGDDGRPLTLALASQPLHGTLSGTVPNLTYTPDPNWNGTDSFNVTADDGLMVTMGTVWLNVASVPDRPTSADITFSTKAGTPIAFNSTPEQFGFSDAADDPPDQYKGIFIVSLPQSGSLRLGAHTINPEDLNPRFGYWVQDPGMLVFEPASGAVGSPYMSFMFRVCDNGGAIGGGDIDVQGLQISQELKQQLRQLIRSDPYTATINVLPPNRAPVATPQIITTDEDTAKTLTLSASDADLDPLFFTVVTPPQHGTLTGLAPDLTYTPDLGYHGADSFTFKANDGTVDSAQASVSITVNAVNHAPVAVDYGLPTDEDVAVVVPLQATDADGDSLAFSIVTGPAHGTLGTIAGGAVTYTPDANFNGNDTFTFKANDGSLDSNVALIELKVASVNDVPVATAEKVKVYEDTPQFITVSGTDVEGDTLTFSIVNAPAHGTLSAIVGDTVAYTPDKDYYGPDAFSFQAFDGTDLSESATIDLEVAPINDAPTTAALSADVDEDTATELTLAGQDVEGGPLTFTIDEPPIHGTLSAVVGDKVTYTPDANYNGPDTFAFRANDGLADSEPASFNLTVKPVNDAPAAGDQAYATDEDTNLIIDAAAGVLAGATDVDGGALTARLIAEPTHGTLNLAADGSFDYTPDANYNGDDSFTFVANDGTADSVVATVRLTVRPVNDAPILGADGAAVTVDEGAIASKAGTWADIDGDAVALNASAGEVTHRDDGTWSWGFATSDGPGQSQRITITVDDGRGGIATTEFDLVVNNVAPVVAPISGSATPGLGTTANYSVSFTDASTSDSHVAAWDWGDGTTTPGSVTEASGAGSAGGSHAWAAPGTYTVTLTLTDSDAATVVATTQVTVAAKLGWVAGDGTYNSPVGAYLAKPTSKGMARFAMAASSVGKYAPTGVFALDLPGAGFSFASRTCEYVRVDAGRVAYRGTGFADKTACTFQVTTVDTKTATDHRALIRIKIWETKTGRVVYDSQRGAQDTVSPTTVLRTGMILSGN